MGRQRKYTPEAMEAKIEEYFDTQGVMLSDNKMMPRLIMATEKTASAVVTALQTLDRVEAILTREERDVLNARYRLLLPWEKIAGKIHFSRKSIFRIRRQIIEKIRDL